MTNVNQPQSPFAQSDDEALQRFNEYKSKDPFPDIPPALLTGKHFIPIQLNMLLKQNLLFFYSITIK